MSEVYSQEIELKGHLIDSMILTKIFDVIMDLKGEFEVQEFKIGRRKDEYSYARMLVKAETREKLEKILKELYRMGATPAGVREAVLAPAPDDMSPPTGFYITTSHPTQVYLRGRWIPVEGISAYKTIVVDPSYERAVSKPVWEIKRGDLVVVGEEGVKVLPPERPREGVGVFEFMGRALSRYSTPSIAEGLAEEMVSIKESGGRIVFVVGSSVVRTGVSDSLASIIHKGFVDGLVSGSRFVLYELEYRLFGTSRGSAVRSGAKPSYGNHVRAAAEITRAGGVREAVRKGVVSDGVIYESIAHETPLVVVSELDDEVFLPGSITNFFEAQREISRLVGEADMVVVLTNSSVAQAVLNAIPSTTKLVLVDINPGVAVELNGREIAQSIGLVSDVSSFLPLLDKALPGRLGGRAH